MSISSWPHKSKMEFLQRAGQLMRTCSFRERITLSFFLLPAGVLEKAIKLSSKCDSLGACSLAPESWVSGTVIRDHSNRSFFIPSSRSGARMFCPVLRRRVKLGARRPYAAFRRKLLWATNDRCGRIIILDALPIFAQCAERGGRQCGRKNEKGFSARFSFSYLCTLTLAAFHSPASPTQTRRTMLNPTSTRPAGRLGEARVPVPRVIYCV